MNVSPDMLGPLVTELRRSPALARKQDVQRVARIVGGSDGAIRNGDDAAAIPDGDGFTLLAAEGMIPEFVQAEPWFAGFCAVMTNVSDIAAMGGRPSALVDVLFSGADPEVGRKVLAGLAAGAARFAVPIVGGHTSRSDGPTSLTAAIVGRARRLITSFDARPGDRLLACVDLRGAFRGTTNNFDAVSRAPPERLRAQLQLLPELAEEGLVHAGKDISMAGLLGTLVMLLETSGCGARVDLTAVPAPVLAEGQQARWLQAFPSFGYLLACRPAYARAVQQRFASCGVSSAMIGEVVEGHALDVLVADQCARFWNLADAPLVGLTGPSPPLLKGATHA